jgi:predicted Ser/Thr protein kinase
MFTSSKNTNLVSEKTRTNNNNIVIPKYNDLINFDKNTDNKEPNESTQFYEQNKNNSISKTTQEMVAQRNVQDKKMSILLQMKKR